MTFRRESFRMEKPVAANYVTPSGVTCVQVKVPDDNEHVALLQGLMAQLTNPDNWQGTEAERAQLAYLWEVAYVATDWGQCVTNNLLQIVLFTINATPLAGAGSLSYNVSSDLPFGFTQFNTGGTLFGMEQPVWLPAGEFTYQGWSTRSTSGGNTDVAITDGTTVIDTIVTGVNQNGTFGTRIQSTGTFTIPTTGLLKVVAANNGTGVGAGRHMNWISHHIRQIA